MSEDIKSQDPFSEDTKPEATPTTQDIQDKLPETVLEANRTLADAFFQYEATTQTTQEIRRKIMTKMLPSILNMDMEVNKGTDADLYASQARMLSEARQLLNDMDTADRNVVNTKLKQKDSDTLAQSSFNAADFLRQIKVGDPLPVNNTVSADDANRLLEKRFDDEGCVILDSELEEGTHMLPTVQASEY